MNDYLLELLCELAPEDGQLQDAIEYAVLVDWIFPTGDIMADCAAIRPKLGAIELAYLKFRGPDIQLGVDMALIEALESIA